MPLNHILSRLFSPVGGGTWQNHFRCWMKSCCVKESHHISMYDSDVCLCNTTDYCLLCVSIVIEVMLVKSVNAKNWMHSRTLHHIFWGEGCVYNIVIWHSYALWNDHHGKNSCHLSPHKVIPIWLTISPYAVSYLPLTYLLYNWKFVPLHPFHLFCSSPHPIPWGSH